MPKPDIRKAAVLLTSLPEEVAGKLMARLTPEEAALISAEISQIGSLGSDEQIAAINDFAKAAQGTIVEAKPFDFLHGVESRSLLTLIAAERPQTIALILRHLHPSRAAEIVGGLSGDQQLEVARRMAAITRTNPEIVHDVEQELERRLPGVRREAVENAGLGRLGFPA